MSKKSIIYKTTGIVLILDQIIKIIINHFLKLHQEIKIIPNFFSLYYVKNTGAAFSIFKNYQVFLIILATAFVLILNKYINKEEKNLHKFESLCLGAIMGGVLGNLFDRIIHKGVIDYLSFTFFGHDFAVFNLADTAIVIGIILYVIIILKEERKTKTTDEKK